MDYYTILQTFIKVAENSSFAAAAESLNVDRSLVSKRIQELESVLGVRLFHRSPRRMSLSADGLLRLDEARRLVAEMDAFFRVRPERLAFRIASSSAFSEFFLSEAVEQYHRSHPDVRLELVTSEDRPDMQAENIDVWFQVGGVTDPEDDALTLGMTHGILCVSGAYLPACGNLRSPDDLRRCRLLSNQALGRRWILRSSREPDAKPVTLQLEDPYLYGNAMQSMHGAERGNGIALLPAAMARPLVEAGRLVRVLPEWESVSRPIRAVVEPCVRNNTRVADFLGFIKRVMK